MRVKQNLHRHLWECQSLSSLHLGPSAQCLNHCDTGLDTVEKAAGQEFQTHLTPVSDSILEFQKKRQHFSGQA